MAAGMSEAGGPWSGVFDHIMRQLLDETGASRTTLRADIEAFGISVNFPVAEALRSGVKSLRGDGSVNQRAADTVNWLESHRTILVQNDFDAEPYPPAALVESYGTKAQMLGPILIGGRLIGWISVHENTGPRQWSAADVAALREATTRVSAIIETLVEPSG